MSALVAAVVLGASTITMPPVLHPGQVAVVSGSGFRQPGAVAALTIYTTDRRYQAGSITRHTVVDSAGNVSIRFRMPRTFRGCTPNPQLVCAKTVFLPGETLRVELDQNDSGSAGQGGGHYNDDGTYLRATSRIASHFRIPRVRLAGRRKPATLRVGHVTAKRLRWSSWGEELATATSPRLAQVRADQMLACGMRVTYQRIRYRTHASGPWTEIQHGSVCPGQTTTQRPY